MAPASDGYTFRMADAYNPLVNNLYMLLATLAGAGLAVQAAVNIQLRAAMGSALWAAIVTATLAAIVLAAAAVFAREGVTLPSLSQHPWWIWIGGIMGGAYVFAIVALTRHLGVALVFAAIVAGQLLTGLLIDHYGWFSVAAQRVSPARALGAALMIAGLVLMRWR